MQLLEYFKELSLQPKNAAELKGLILQLAVQGKLTAKWREENPDVEPAFILLSRITEEKELLLREKKIKKEKAILALTDEDQPYKLPQKWIWCRLGNYTHYGAFSKCEPKEAKADTWVLELEDIEKESSKLLQKVRFSKRNFRSTKSNFVKSDVIYGKLRPYLDKVIVADENGVCTTEMIPIKSFAKSSSEYLRFYLKNPDFISYANNSTHGMRMPRMGTDIAKNAIIAIPPPEEQKAIVQVVKQLLAEVAQLEQLTNTRITLKEDFCHFCLTAINPSRKHHRGVELPTPPFLQLLYRATQHQKAKGNHPCNSPYKENSPHNGEKITQRWRMQLNF